MEEVDAWLKKAEKDLKAAEINLQQGVYEVSAFLPTRRLKRP
jgi:HEPN domain-containing protein